jgi:sarcosine oxidase, subunit gamma
MLEPIERTVPSGAGAATQATAVSAKALLAGWRTGPAIVNLRGDPGDPAFRAIVSSTLALELPVRPLSTVSDSVHRVVWVGPDEWFVLGPKGHAAAIEAGLRSALASIHHSATDVSGGYAVLQLGGTPVRDVLAQGCPLDLHPREFGVGASAGSHFFKAAIWIWQTDEAPRYEVLVRSSFKRYVWLMLERSTLECGLVALRAA